MAVGEGSAMRAMAVTDDGPGLRPIVRERPSPGPGEVRVAVAFCGVNHLDRMIVEGTLPGGAPRPRVPGAEVSGTIEAVGAGVTALSEGQAVVVAPYLFCGLCESCRRGRETLCRRGDILGLGTDGGYAQAVVVAAANVLPVPAGLALETAAALPLAAATAFHMLAERARVRAGEWVLILGVGGGVASAGLRLARLMGARVIAASRSPAKLERADADGADHTLLVEPPAADLAKRVRALTGGAGADVVFDPLGSAYWRADVASLARGGRLVTCGALAGAMGETDIWLTFAKELELLGSYGASRADVAAVMSLAAAGRFAPAVADCLPLSMAQEAHDRLRRSEVYGKILLAPV